MRRSSASGGSAYSSPRAATVVKGLTGLPAVGRCLHRDVAVDLTRCPGREQPAGSREPLERLAAGITEAPYPFRARVKRGDAPEGGVLASLARRGPAPALLAKAEEVPGRANQPTGDARIALLRRQRSRRQRSRRQRSRRRGGGRRRFLRRGGRRCGWKVVVLGWRGGGWRARWLGGEISDVWQRG